MRTVFLLTATLLLNAEAPASTFIGDFSATWHLLGEGAGGSAYFSAPISVRFVTGHQETSLELGWDFDVEVAAGVTSTFGAQIQSIGRYTSEDIVFVPGSIPGTFRTPFGASAPLLYSSTLSVAGDQAPDISGNLSPPASGESDGVRSLTSMTISTLTSPYPLSLSFTLAGGNAGLAAKAYHDEEEAYSLYALSEPRYTVQLRELLPGDFNDDGFVDIADYTVWRDQAGVTIPAVTSYAAWIENFGRSLSNESQATPEPNSLILLLVAAGNLKRRAFRRVAGALLQGSPRD